MRVAFCGRADQEAGDKAEQGNNTEARQRKRAGIRVRAKTRIQSWAPAHPIKSAKIVRDYYENQRPTTGSGAVVSFWQPWLVF